MFYHFKGQLIADDYLPLVKRTARVMQIVMTAILLVFLIVNIATRASLATIIVSVVFIILANVYMVWSSKRGLGARFQPQDMDQFITKEQLTAQMTVTRVLVVDERVYLFAGKRVTLRPQVAIFPKRILEDATQWEPFVEMAQGLATKKK